MYFVQFSSCAGARTLYSTCFKCSGTSPRRRLTSPWRRSSRAQHHSTPQPTLSSTASSPLTYVGASGIITTFKFIALLKKSPSVHFLGVALFGGLNLKMTGSNYSPTTVIIVQGQKCANLHAISVYIYIYIYIYY